VNAPIDIKNRKPIWIVLSELYLDMELKESDIIYIAKVIKESPYRLEEVKRINKYEVFPVLYQNLMSPAGQWTGFDESWLVESIQSSLENRNEAKSLAIEMGYAVLKAMFDDYWKAIETIYSENKN